MIVSANMINSSRRIPTPPGNSRGVVVITEDTATEPPGPRPCGGIAAVLRSSMRIMVDDCTATGPELGRLSSWPCRRPHLRTATAARARWPVGPLAGARPMPP